jgi:hypothetical protein
VKFSHYPERGWSVREDRATANVFVFASATADLATDLRPSWLMPNRGGRPGQFYRVKARHLRPMRALVRLSRGR